MTNTQFYETIARFYDAENRDFTEDLVLYAELAEETGGPILDVGCGTGRVMLHLAQEGHRVVGVERSQAMLERGLRKLDRLPDLKPRVTFILGDALEVELPEHFNMIIVPYNTLMHFSEQADQIALLRRCHALLDDDGLLVLDLPNASELAFTEGDNSLMLERMFTEPESGHLVMQQSVSTLDRVAQQLHITWIYDEITKDGSVRRTLAPLVLRYIFSGEMDLMLNMLGLCRVATYGDYSQAPFVDGSPRMIVLAEKVPESTP